MRINRILLLIVLVFLMYSCSKNNNSPTPLTNSSIVGKWILTTEYDTSYFMNYSNYTHDTLYLSILNRKYTSTQITNGIAKNTIYTSYFFAWMLNADGTGSNNYNYIDSTLKSYNINYSINYAYINNPNANVGTLLIGSTYYTIKKLDNTQLILQTNYFDTTYYNNLQSYIYKSSRIMTFVRG